MDNKTPTPDHGTALERFKFCPLCGHQGFSNPQENYLQCNYCQFVFYVNPPVSVLAILKNERNEILLTKRKYDPEKGKYDFPGGFVGMQESLEIALAREIKEELNLEIDNLTYLNSLVTRYPCKGLTYYPVDTVFECRVKNWDVLKIQDDVADIKFLSVSDIKDKDLAFASHKYLVQLLQKKEHEIKTG